MNLTLSLDNNFFLFELNGATTWVPRLNGVPDLSRLSEPYKTDAQAALTTWLADGNTIPVPVAPPIVPQPREIDARRLRIALLQLGYLAKVEAAIASADEETKIEWDFATIIKEDYPLVKSLAFASGLTAENINAIFELALSLP